MRDPFATPAERTAQAMAKMTPGTLRGASRIATPGRAPGRPKRVPLTAPLTTFAGLYATRAGGNPLGLSNDYTPDAPWTMAGLRVTGTNPTGASVTFVFIGGYGDGSWNIAGVGTTDTVFDLTAPPDPGYENIEPGTPYRFGIGGPDDVGAQFWAYTAGADTSTPTGFTEITWPTPS